jgi:transcriptional regulator with XRE-family HTH domain
MEHSRIPNSLKRYRRIAGYSQKEVGVLLQLQKSSNLSRWEKGLSFPGTKYLFQLCILYKTLPENIYSEVWDKISLEVKRHEKELLAQQESLVSKEKYYL